MSETIDNKVVEMRFDNAQFESATKQTMSTLERLKKALKFDGASKGLDDISKSAKNVNFSGLDNGVQTLQARFSALQVVGVTALANITNSAIQAGKNIVSSFTIDPITDGLREYETQMNAIQTILANTQSKGTTLEQVNSALAELNKYADLTIYNFSEMTRNIGTFTAAGVDLDTAVSSIKGISNLAAVSGSSATQASTAMYQLSQAIATGTVKLMDWNSVVNAGMGGELFQNALKRTAEHFGTDVDAMIEKYGSFRESLSQGGWLTTQVLTETLAQLSGAYTEADLIAQGYSESQAKEIAQMAETATNAATKVKTFTQLMSTLKEAIGSGWATTWQLIFGDFEEARDFFTDLSNHFGAIIQTMSDARNKLLGDALTSPFERLSTGLENAGIKIEDFQKNFADLGEEQLKSIGYTEEEIAKIKELAAESEKAGIPLNDLINNLSKQSGRELLIESMWNVITAIEKPLSAISKAWKEVFKFDSSALYNMVDGFNKLTKSLILNDTDAENLSRTFKGLFSIIHIISTLTGKSFITAFKVADGILRFFGTNLLEVTATIGDAVYAFDQFITSSEFLSAAIEGVGNLLLWAGDFAVQFFKGFAEWPIVKSATTIISDFFGELITYTKQLMKMDPGEAIKKIFKDVENAFSNAKNYLKNLTWDDVISALSRFGEKVREVFKDVIDQMKEIGPDIVEGLQNGLKENVETVYEWMKEIGTKLVETIKAVLGIHSPSTVMYDVGKNIVLGLINGIRDFIGGVSAAFGTVGEDIKNVLMSIDWGSVAVSIISVGAFINLYKMADALQSFGIAAKQVTKPFASAGKVMDSVAGAIDAVTGRIEGSNSKFLNIANGIKIIATAIAILAGAVAGLALIDQDKLIGALGAVAVLAGIIAVLAAVLGKIDTKGTALQSMQLNAVLLSVSASLAIMAGAIAIVSNVPWDGLKKAGAGLAAFAAVVAALILITRFAGDQIGHVPALMIKLSVAFALLAVTAKIIGGMSDTEIENASTVLSTFAGIIASLIVISKIPGGSMDGVADIISKVGVAFLLLAATMKIIATMEWDEMQKAGVGIVGLGVIIAALVGVLRLAGGKSLAKVGSSLLMLVGSIALLALIANAMSGIDPEKFAKGLAAVSILGAMVSALVGILRLAGGGQIAKVTASLFAMSLSIAVLAGISVLLGMVDQDNLEKGIAAVGALSALVAAMTLATKGARDVKGSFIGIAVAIGVLAASVVILSFIDSNKLVSSVAALSVVMAMLAVVVRQMNNMVGVKVGPMVTLVAVIVSVSAALAILAQMPWQSLLAAGVSLSAVLVALGISMSYLDGISKISPSALIGAAVLGAIAVALAYALSLLKDMDPATSIANAVSLSALLVALSQVTATLAMVGPGAKAAIQGAVAMAGVIAVIAGIVAAAGAIKQIPGADWLVSEGGEFLQKIGEALGKLVGGIAGGALEGVSDSLPSVATNLSTFMTNLTPFINGIKMVDPSVAESAANLAGAIMAISGAGLIDAIASFVTGQSSMEQFAAQIVPFGQAMMAYSQAVSGIDANAVTASATAGQALAQLAGSLPKSGGLAQAIFGENPELGDFGSQLVSFGTAIKQYSVAIAGIDSGAISASATAGQALAQLAGSLPKSGGLAQAIFGENPELDDFGTQLVSFGQGLKSYAEAVVGLDIASIQNSVAAGQALTQLADSLPKEDGWLDALLGGQENYEEFGAGLSSFGSALASYANSISGIDFASISTATTEVNSILTMFKSMEGFDTSGVSSFAQGLKTLADSSLDGFVEAFENGKDRIKVAVDALLKSIPTAMSSLAESIMPIAVSAGTNFATGLSSGMYMGVVSMTATVVKMVNLIVSGIRAQASQFNSAGRELATQLANGTNSNKDAITNNLKGPVMSAASAIRGYYGQFYSAGIYLCQGLANGISAGSYTVRARAAAMASAAASAARRALDINSPSKVFRKIGYSIPEGMAQGIDRMTKMVTASSESMADSAVAGTNAAIKKISDFSFNSIDANPMIRPVVDLSNVEKGADSISGMFSSMVPVSLLGEVGSINRSMNGSVQNGTIDDVVSAVNKLRKDLGNVGNTSYNINGITYDDGTAIGNAIGELYRAMRLEGRI